MTFLKIGGAEMKSKCSRLGRRKMGKNEKLRNAQSHADPDMEKHLRSLRGNILDKCCQWFYKPDKQEAA